MYRGGGECWVNWKVVGRPKNQNLGGSITEHSGRHYLEVDSFRGLHNQIGIRGTILGVFGLEVMGTAKTSNLRMAIASAPDNLATWHIPNDHWCPLSL